MRASRPLIGLAAASVLLLTGCGVAGTDFHPGIAATVGDDSITTDHVDQVASDYCTAITSQLKDSKQVLPLRYLRGGVAGQLTLVEAAKQLGEEYDVGPGTAYQRKVSDLQQAVSTLPDDVQDAVIEVEASTTYLSDVLVGVGKVLLKEQGTASPSDDAAATLGQQTLATWVTDHDVEIDPRYGVEIVKGQAVPVDTNVSVAVGDAAKNGLLAEPDQAYAASLPANHICG